MEQLLKMKFITFILVLFSLTSTAQTCCIYVQGKPARLKDRTLKYRNTRITYFGNSITAGSFVSAANRWTTVLTGLLNAREDNRGVGGMSMQHTVYSDFIDILSTVPVKADSLSLLVISFGINDVNAVVNDVAVFSAAGFQTSYDSALTYITTVKQWATRDILLIAPNYINLGSQYDATLQQYIGIVASTAATWGTQYVSPFPAFDGHPELLLDGVHPGTAGHLLLANTIYNALQ